MEEKRKAESSSGMEPVDAKPDVRDAKIMGEDRELLDPDNLANYEIDPAEERLLLRTLDWHIAPTCMILYLIAFLDRANIGNAAVGGMVKDLNLPWNGLSVATSVMYVTYCLGEVPFTMLLRTLRPSRLIPACMIVWGFVVLGNGFAQNYATLLACRLLLGLCEAGLFPSLVLYMSSFYQREELALRNCYLFIAACLSGVVGGLIATGFLKMDGLQGIRGWRWLYIIEGAITVVVGIWAAFAIADRYETATYLTERQKFLMKVRQAKASAYTRDEGFSWPEFKQYIRDPMIYLSGFVLLCMDTCMYGFSTFLVVILNGLGYSPVVSQALSAPVYAWAAIVYLFGAIISDRYSIRYKMILPFGLFPLVGYAILVAHPANLGAQLFACFLAGMGIYICVGLHVTWLGQNVAGFRKRSYAIGIQLTMGNIGGVLAGQIYRTVDKPVYRLGHGASLAFWFVALVFATLEWYVWRGRNLKREAMSQKEKDEMDDAGVTGDAHYDFRYAL